MRVADKVLAPPPRQAGVVTNQPERRGNEPVSATVILFDRLNTQVEDQAFARLQALKYLRNSGRNEQISILSLTKTLKTVQAFTADRDVLVKAVDKATVETSVDLTADTLVQDLPVTGEATADAMTRNAASNMLQNARQRRADTTTAAFATVARHLKGLPGRKKLIWITSGLPLSFSEQQEHNLLPTIEFQNLSERFPLPARMLNDSNVALYAIDPRGVKAGLNDDSYGSMNYLADATGGKAVYASNDIAGGIGEFIADTDVTYTLGFYPPEDRKDDSFHSLSVKVNRPGAEVRSRRGYGALAVKPLTEKQRGSTLTAWAEEPLDATEIRINAGAFAVAGKPNVRRVDVGIDASALQMEEKAGRWTGMVEVAILYGNATGKKTKGTQQTLRLNLKPERLQAVLSGGMVVSSVVPVINEKGKPIATTLRVVVMDGTSGKAGSVRIPISN
jgi:VWFA-related protein